MDHPFWRPKMVWTIGLASDNQSKGRRSTLILFLSTAHQPTSIHPDGQPSLMDPSTVKHTHPMYPTVLNVTPNLHPSPPYTPPCTPLYYIHSPHNFVHFHWCKTYAVLHLYSIRMHQSEWDNHFHIDFSTREHQWKEPLIQSRFQLWWISSQNTDMTSPPSPLHRWFQ